MSMRPRLIRSGPVLGTAIAVAFAVAAIALARYLPIRSDAGPHAFETLLIQLAEVAACCVCGWLSLATAVTVLATLRGAGSLPARIAVHVTPRGWARILGLVIGGAVTLGPVAAAGADEGTSPPPPVAGLRLPDRPVGEAYGTPPRSAAVVVRRGDTLWELAAARLPAGSDDLAVARACRRLYAANRAAIGPDPDLLLPGTRLDLPSDDRETNQ